MMIGMTNGAPSGIKATHEAMYAFVGKQFRDFFLLKTNDINLVKVH